MIPASTANYKRSNPYAPDETPAKASKGFTSKATGLSVYDNPADFNIQKIEHVVAAGLNELRNRSPLPIVPGFKAKVYQANKLWHGQIKKQNPENPDRISAMCSEILLQAEKFSEEASFTITCGGEVIQLNSYAFELLKFHSEFFEAMAESPLLETHVRRVDLSNINMNGVILNTILAILSSEKYIDIPDDQTLSFIQICHALRLENVKSRSINILLAKISSATYSMQTLLEFWHLESDQISQADKKRIQFECEIQMVEILKNNSYTQVSPEIVSIDSQEYVLPPTVAPVTEVIEYLRTEKVDLEHLQGLIKTNTANKSLLAVQFCRYLYSICTKQRDDHTLGTKELDQVVTLIWQFFEVLLRDYPESPFVLKEIARFYIVGLDEFNSELYEPYVEKLISQYRDVESLLLRVKAFIFGLLDFDVSDEEKNDNDPESSKTKRAYYLFDQLTEYLKYHPQDLEAMYFRMRMGYSYLINYGEKKGLLTSKLYEVLERDAETLVKKQFEIGLRIDKDPIQWFQLAFGYLQIRQKIFERSSEFETLTIQLRELYSEFSRQLSSNEKLTSIADLRTESIKDINNAHMKKFKTPFPYEL